MVSILTEKEESTKPMSWKPTEDERKRGLRVHSRLQEQLDYRRRYEPSMERGLLLYSGKMRDMDDPSKVRVVAPLAKAFVDAKTAEEVKAMNGYEFIAGKNPADEWMTRIMKDANDHVQRVIQIEMKRIQAIRQKNIMGVSIIRVGYRKIMREVKEPTETDEDNNILAWSERKVPVYDDLFADLVSPFNFVVDPNAKTMNDAMDCGHFHFMHKDEFSEIYCDNPIYKHTDIVEGGKSGLFHKDSFVEGSFRGQKPTKDMVVISEYWNKVRAEYIVYANGIEIYAGAMEDFHGELPFVSYHNNPCYVTGYSRDFVARSSDGSETTMRDTVQADETFWTEGDPMTLADLIDLRTGMTRAAHRAIKLAGETIIATAGDKQFDESRPWRSGDQAIGMMGQFQSVPLGGANLSAFDFAFNDIFEQMILAAGIDPRSLSDSKAKTATESQIQKETSMRRLEMNIMYNELNAEVRLGTLILKLIEQRYSKPELVRLTGRETKEELENFDSIEKDEKNLPLFGRRYRNIASKDKLKEKKRKIMKWSDEDKKLVHDGKSYKYYLTKAEDGVHSFIARPEYIRSSSIHVIPESGRRAGELRSVKIAQIKEIIQLFLSVAQLTQSINGSQPLLKLEDAPNLGYAIKELVKEMNWSVEKAIGMGEETKVFNAEEEAQLAQLMKPTNFSQPIESEEQPSGMIDTSTSLPFVQ